MIGVCSLLGLSPSACFGQHTEFRDAGGGRRMEFVYDAAGHVVETRTVDKSGRLQGRVEHEYHPGFFVPQEITTSFWPDGKTVRSVGRVLYDENANFTGELLDLFNEAGVQAGGTKLTHDPFTGIYRCSKWDPSAHAYQATECPATEESAEAPEKAKELTRNEAMKQLELARQARREEQKVQRMERKSPIQPSTTTGVKELSVILPAHLRPGERVSGSIVEDSQKYDEVQDISVIRIKLPMGSEGEGAALAAWAFEAPGEHPQRADGPTTFTVPHSSQLTLRLRQVRNPARSVSCEVSVAKNSPPQKTSGPQTFEAPAVCLKGDLCPVRGPFGGDSAKTLIAFGSRPAAIVAETEDIAYVSVPDGLATGSTHLLVADGSQVTALPIDIAELRFTPARRELREGETLLIHAVLSGPEELADQLWQAGVFPPAFSVEKAREAFPGFEPPKQGKEGVILVVIRNPTPEAVSFRGSKDQTFVFKLTPDSFTNGEFKYQFVVEAAKSASFAIQGTALPFLAPVQGQRF
jgi:YD repeat-containing protein